MQGRAEPDFSLSGLKTALRLEAESIAPLSNQDVADLCASFQQAVGDVVHDRLRAGMKVFRVRYGTPTALVAAAASPPTKPSARCCSASHSRAASSSSCRRASFAPTTAQ